MATEIGEALAEQAAPADRAPVPGTAAAACQQETVDTLVDLSLPESDRSVVIARTGREIAEDEFRNSDDIYHLMLNNIKDYGIIMLDPEGHVVTWNAGAQAITGYDAEEALGRSYSLFNPKSDLENAEPENELAYARSSGRFAGEGWRFRKDGTPFWADVIVTALRDPKGRLLGFAKVLRDMSERKRAEASDAVKTQDLIGANKELEAFRLLCFPRPSGASSPP